MSQRGSVASNDSLNGNCNLGEMDTRQKIRYKPQDIVVEKRPGKRTATAFCSFRASRTKPSSTACRSKSNSVNESDNDAASNASSALHFSCDSDHSDTLSIVSDISELSILSDVMRSHNNSRVPIVGVHGHGTKNVKGEMKRLNEQLAMFKSENEEYQKQAMFVTGHRQEIFQLKSKNFGLQRENANLLSQLKSAQDMCDSLKLTIEEVQSKRAEMSKLSMEVRCKSDCKMKLRNAHDEMFRLKNELNERKLDAKGKSDEVTRLRNKCVTLETSLDEMSRNLQVASVGKSSAENALRILQSEKESFVKSRDWYRDQMRAAQEARSATQRELSGAQKESSSTIERLQLELARAKVELDEERVRSLKEKDGLKRQLEDLVVVERDQLVKTAVSDQAQVRECEDEVERMAEIVKNLQSELAMTSKKLQEKSSTIVSLRSEVSELQEKYSDLKIRRDDLQLKFEATEAELQSSEMQVRALQESVEELRTNLELEKERLMNEVNLLKENLEKSISHRNSDHDRLKQAKSELISFAELSQNLEREFENLKTKSGAEISELQLENEKLSKELKEKEDEVLTISEMLQISGAKEQTYKEELKRLNDQALSAEEKARQLQQEVESKARQIEQILKDQYNTELESPQKSRQNSADDDKIRRLETLLNDSISTIDVLERKNTEFSRRLESARNRIEELESRQNFVDSDDVDEIGIDELKSVQARKIVRLECTMAVLEAEVSHLSSTIADLEEQVLKLEQENGRLIVEAQQNDALKGQIRQLQQDIRKDTDLRKELLSAIEVARTSLLSEISDLESALFRERESHSETKSRLLQFQHEIEAEREEIRVRQESKREMTKKACLLPDSATSRSKSADEESLAADIEKDKLTIGKLEDEVKHLEQKLEEVKSESGIQLEVLGARCERQEVELLESRAHCKALRAEILELTQKTDALSDEKNAYRSQVQDMNTALKNSLEHIRRLRTRSAIMNNTRSSVSAAASPATSPLPPISPTSSLDETTILEMLNSTPATSKNLSNLQNCLASLKSEMVVLQSKLAPSSTTASPSRRPKRRDLSNNSSLANSSENSPRK